MGGWLSIQRSCYRRLSVDTIKRVGFSFSLTPRCMYTCITEVLIGWPSHRFKGIDKRDKVKNKKKSITNQHENSKWTRRIFVFLSSISISVMCFSWCTHGEGLASHQFHTTSQADPPLSLLAPLSIASIERVTRPFSPLTSIEKQSNNNNSLPFTLRQKKRPLYVHPNLVCSCIYTRTYKHTYKLAGWPSICFEDMMVRNGPSCQRWRIL